MKRKHLKVPVGNDCSAAGEKKAPATPKPRMLRTE